MMREGIPKGRASMSKLREARVMLIRDWERRLRDRQSEADALASRM